MGWQLTATTIYCEAVEDEVTLMLYRDGTITCTGYKRYGEPGKETAKLVKSRSKQLKRQLKCEGMECRRVVQHKDRLLSEEAKKGNPA